MLYFVMLSCMSDVLWLLTDMIKANPDNATKTKKNLRKMRIKLLNILC